MKTIFFLFLFSWASATAQITLTGVVVDESNNQPLAFVNVFCGSGEGGVTNESGKFAIEVKTMPASLEVSYVGYESKKIPLREGTLFYLIKIAPVALQLMEIKVLATDENAAHFFYDAIENSRRASLKARQSKTFRRTYSTIGEGKPTELLEGFYNATLAEGGVRAFEIKNGRVGVPLDHYLLQFDLCKVLEGYNFYGDNNGYLPRSPLKEKSAKKILKDYYIKYSGSYVAASDTIVKITFESKKPGEAFDGVVFINNTHKQIVRVTHEVKKAEHIPFYLVKYKGDAALENMGIKWDTGFEVTEGAPLPRYMHLIIQMDFVEAGQRSLMKANSKFFFFDYSQLFTLPIFSEFADMNDYDQILSVPYHPDFWKTQSSSIPETGMEERFRRDLENSQLFVNYSPTGGNIELLNNKYQLVQEGIKPAWSKIKSLNMEAYNSMTRSTLGSDSYKGLFAKTLFSLDYNCHGDSADFRVAAVLDYSGSYMNDQSQRERSFFVKYLQFSDNHAHKFENILKNKYRNKCPSRDELLADLKNAEKTLKKDLFALFNGQNDRSEAYLQTLEALLNERNTQ